LKNNQRGANVNKTLPRWKYFVLGKNWRKKRDCRDFNFFCNKTKYALFYFLTKILSQMTYIIKLLDPRAQALLEALVQMNMVDMTQVSESVDKIAAKREAIKTQRFAEIKGSLQEVNAHRRGEIQLQTLNEFLKELD
jgi:hypothetical protein